MYIFLNYINMRYIPRMQQHKNTVSLKDEWIKITPQ